MMQRLLIVLAATLACALSFPQSRGEQAGGVGGGCRTQVAATTQQLAKVVCETEFREQCEVRVETSCRNVTTGRQECRTQDTFTCVDSTATRCGQEQVLKNVTVQETSCRQVVEDICEMEAGPGGAAVPVAGSCVSKEVEECGPVTRQEERFVEEEVCREIPIKDCKDVQEEVCQDQVERVCEDTEREQCDIVPHEECRQVLETEEVTQVVCDDKEAMTTTEEAASIPDLSTILEIFGVTNKENEVDIDDAFVPSSTTTTTTTTTTTASTTTTVSTTTTTASTTTTVPSTSTVTTTTSAKESEFTTSVSGGRVAGDGSRIVFDSEAINSRIHHHQDHPGVFPTSTPATTTTRRRQQQPNSLIFFPE